LSPQKIKQALAQKVAAGHSSFDLHPGSHDVDPNQPSTQTVPSGQEVTSQVGLQDKLSRPPHWYPAGQSASELHSFSNRSSDSQPATSVQRGTKTAAALKRRRARGMARSIANCEPTKPARSTAPKLLPVSIVP